MMIRSIRDGFLIGTFFLFLVATVAMGNDGESGVRGNGGDEADAIIAAVREMQSLGFDISHRIIFTRDVAIKDDPKVIAVVFLNDRSTAPEGMRRNQPVFLYSRINHNIVFILGDH